MPAVALGTSYSVRNVAKTAPVLLSNMVLEQDDTNLVDGKMRIGRPALRFWQAVGQGPIRAVFQRKGVLSGDFIVHSGTEVWRVPSAVAAYKIGDISANPAQIAGGETGIVLCDGSAAYSYDGTNYAQVSMPDNVPVQSVAYLSGYFFLAQTGSQRIYYIAPGETSPDGLDFFSAESQPDAVVALGILSDELWIFGETSVEVWSPSGDQDAPLTRQSGRLYNRGIASRNSLVYADNTLFFVGDDLIVYRSSTVPKAISDNSISEAIRAAVVNIIFAWSFSLDNHTYYVMSVLDTTGTSKTFVYDVTTSSWSRWSTLEASVWAGFCGAQSTGYPATIVAGQANTPNLYHVDATFNIDSDQNGDVPILRELVGGVGVTGPDQRCDSLSVCAAMGWSPDPDEPAILQVRWSEDQGQTWGDWRDMSLGKQGQYAGLATLRLLGRMKAPGRIFHFRMSDPAISRISYARVNEAFA